MVDKTPEEAAHVADKCLTRLGAFLRLRGIKPAALALESSLSRAHIYRLRIGKLEPTRPKMLAIRDACSRLLKREVHLIELFDLGVPLPIVTPEHGDIFAREWYEHSLASLAMYEAFQCTNLATWPDERDAQVEFENIEDEICERVFDATRQAISDAFVKVATDVLARERSRG